MQRIKGYHAHVYFDADTVEQARALRERVDSEFDYAVGRFHEKNVGPHLRWNFQIAFKAEEFGTIVPWLALNRKGLTVLVHGISSNHRFWDLGGADAGAGRRPPDERNVHE